MRALLLAAFLFCAGAENAAADRFSLTYEGATLGFIGLGEASLDAEVTDEDYRITATMRSGGLLRLFERTDLTAQSSGEIQNGAVHWRSYDLDHRYSRKRRVVAMRVDDAGALEANIEPNYRLWGEPPATEAQQRRSRDPLSTLIAMAVDVGQSRRCAGAYSTFDGRFHYLLELSGGEIDDFRGGGYEGQVLKCSLAYIAVSGFEPTDSGRRRIPHGEAWFALQPDSSFAPPVRIATPLAAGGAVIRLTQWRRAIVNVADPLDAD